MVYDCNTHKRTILGEFYSLPDKRFLLENKHEPHYSEWGGGPFRVDLHPRWSFSDYTVCFDSIHEGKRGVYTIDLHKVLDTD